FYYPRVKGNGGKNSGRGRARAKRGVFAFPEIARRNPNGTWTVAKNSGRDRDPGCDLFPGGDGAVVPLLPAAIESIVPANDLRRPASGARSKSGGREIRS